MVLSCHNLNLQRIALAWMHHKETASVHCLGGILADDQVIYLVKPLTLIFVTCDLSYIAYTLCNRALVRLCQ